jgi:hypothetical protein
MTGTVSPRRPRVVASVLLAFMMTTGTLAAGSGLANAKTSPAKLKGVVSVSPKAATVGQRVMATVSKSVLPKGDKLKSIRLSWGDHTKTVTLSSLKAKPTHRYARPGRYTVVLVLTDRHKKVARASLVEKVTAPKSSLPAGSYTGTDGQNWGVALYVSANGKSLQDVWVAVTALQCTPDGGGVNDQLQVPSVAVKADGSFSSTTTQSGVFAGHPATFTYVFAGRVSGRASSGAPQLSGTLRENIDYTDLPARRCTTNSQPWTAARDSQPAQPTTAPPTGSYSGRDAQNWGVTFYVAASGNSLQDVSVPVLALACIPDGGGVDDRLVVASVPLNPDGSFSSTITQTGVFSGHPATFTYVFRGNVHGLSTGGLPRLAGTLRENADYTDIPARQCTSNDQPWTAVRDSQPAQPNTVPAGNYSGTDVQNWGVKFSVTAGGASLQNVSAPVIALECTPDGGGVDDQLLVGSVPLNADGSFTSTTTQTGVFSGHPATFTYVFRGNVHGLSGLGLPRLAGTLREDIDYNGIPARHCTSDDLAWLATLTSP